MSRLCKFLVHRVQRALTLHYRRQRLRYRVNMYTIKEEREIAPETFARLTSSALYERRFGPFYVNPVIAGLSTTPSGGVEPVIASTDTIGCLSFAKDFAVAGTASDELYGVAEGLWEPDLEPDDLFETISQTLLNAVDRNALSGWGAIVHIMLVFTPISCDYLQPLTIRCRTKDKIITRRLRGRMD